MTERLPATAEGIRRAADLLAAGEIVAFPTDTVYGVGVAGSRPDLLPALFELKRRPAELRIPMLVAGADDLAAGAWDLDERAHRLIERFWPGALTLVLRATTSDETQAFRAPDSAVALELIRSAGPLLATSANLSGDPDTLGADDVLIAFATQQDALAAVVDGGVVPGGVASTVLDLTQDPARILREGPISRDELAAVIELAR
jgi:tRNA threonylcarbamoyl adenosine modification protein (Sua5/YciO/YrdC/YwlC family)